MPTIKGFKWKKGDTPLTNPYISQLIAENGLKTPFDINNTIFQRHNDLPLRDSQGNVRPILIIYNIFGNKNLIRKI